MPVLLDHHHLSILGEGDDINPVIGVNDVELPGLFVLGETEVSTLILNTL